jgi:CheY-like chemotaxis protein
LSEIDMPGMDGRQLLGEIRRLRPDLPVLMVIACGDDERKRRAKAAGAIAFLAKLIDLEQLKQQLLQLIPSNSGT